MISITAEKYKTRNTNSNHFIQKQNGGCEDAKRSRRV